MTGSLKISDLRAGDSGLYTGQITCGDGFMHQVQFNVTVVDAAPVIHPESPLTSGSEARHHWTEGICGFFFLCVSIGLLLIAHCEKKKPGPEVTDMYLSAH
ncbi:uncharacterized protein [Eucyclogobius newberryi]|uniref:uncharacterized protein n=1 Tax=Eucyclogobius newberryi TaxID=166745 RepID=UPI003B5C1B97